MAVQLNPGQLGSRIGEVLVGLKQGTLDTPEALISTEGSLHVLGATQPYGINADAGGRTRVSQITTLFGGKKLNADDPLKWVTVGTGTLTFQQNKALMEVTAGQYLIRQSPHYNPYFEGKSQIVEPTFDNFQPQAGVVKRVGYFSSNAVAPYDTNKDGFWIESDGTTIRLIVSRFGVEVLNLPWTEWDAYAAISTYNWQNFTVMFTDFLWLGGAVLRVLMKVNGHIQLVHTFDYAGTSQDVFMQSPNQPMRYEIRSSSGAGSFREICSQVSTEGSIGEGGQALVLANAPGSAISAGTVGTTYVIRGVKKQVANRDSHPVIVDFGGAVISAGATDAGRFLLLLNPTLSAALTYTDKGRVQDGAAVAGQTVTSLGREIGAVEAVGSGVAAPFPDNYLATLLIDINDSPYEVVLAYQPFTTNQDVHGHITLKDD